MSSAFKNEEKKEEVTPEALLERLKNAKTSDDVFRFLEDLSSLILDAIYKAESDAKTKYDALFNFGMTVDSIYMMLLSFQLAEDLSLYNYDLRNEIMDSLKKLIEVYGELRKGESLDSAKTTFGWMPTWNMNQIRHFYERLKKHVDMQEPI